MIECPVCLNNKFIQTDILSERLIREWGLSQKEINYINKQQGFQCTSCGCKLRSMTLAASIMKQYNFQGCFKDFFYSNVGRRYKLLEINEAGGLHPFLSKFRYYQFVEYPAIDIQNLSNKENTFDLIVHSDTLEHVKNSLAGLKECYRILKKGGKLFYTIPIVYERMTKKRDLLPNSYHGIQNESQGEDYKVWTEYGADFWVELIDVGFRNISLFTLEDQTSIAICADKLEDYKYQKKIETQLFKYLKRTKRNLKSLIKKKWN
jgi:SAM-dependent methyltransferase